jgi:hypothetical protein
MVVVRAVALNPFTTLRVRASDSGVASTAIWKCRKANQVKRKQNK